MSHNKHGLREKIIEAILPTLEECCEEGHEELADACAEAMVALNDAMSRVICIATLPGSLSDEHKQAISKMVFDGLNKAGLAITGGIKSGFEDYIQALKERN